MASQSENVISLPNHPATTTRTERLGCGLDYLFAISDFVCGPEFHLYQEQMQKLLDEQKQRQLNKETINETAFDSYEDVKLELFTESDNKYTCKICGKELKKSNSIEDHIRTHTGEKPYKCKECNKSFSQSVSLNLHMRVHTVQISSNKCQLCDAEFDDSTDIVEHMKSHTYNTPRNYKCFVCGKVFGSSSKLKRHLPIHTGEKRFKCQKCNKRFTQGSSLNKHLKVVHDFDIKE